MALPEPDSDLAPGRSIQPSRGSSGGGPVAGPSAGSTDGLDAARARALQLGRVLRARGLCLSTAESCTGGLLGAMLTDAAGSSDYYLGGVIAYANAIKVTLLGVSVEILATQGAVSQAVARQMARGVAERSGADLAVSITGIAGPGGGSPEKPVGTVWIGWLGPDGERQARFRFEGDRAAVRTAAAIEALKGLQAILNEG